MQISHRHFGSLPDGQAVTCWTLRTEQGLEAEILDYGATIRTLSVPDRSGKQTDVVLGYDTLEEYLKNPNYFGATIGRFANRIRAGRFSLNGQTYTLAVNNGPNHLHGGLVGFDKHIWQAEETPEGLRFSRLSPHMEEGYPGNLQVSVTFSLEKSALTIRYEAQSDQDTILNLTNHSYFNLSGSGDIQDHLLQIASDAITPNDPDCLPTGEIMPVAGTAVDFRQPKAVGRDADLDEPCVKSSGGYDVNFILSGSPGAVLQSPKTGIVMTMTTDQPGVQLYTCNGLPERRGKNGAHYGHRAALCLETQRYPDCIHHPEWPTCILRAGEVFRSFTTYSFSTENT